MQLSQLQLLSERDQPHDAVWLLGFDGSQTIFVTISRALLAELATHYGIGSLAPSDQNYLVSINLDQLLPVAEGRRTRGEVGQHTDRNTGRTTPLIELTRDDVEQGIKRIERAPPDISGSLSVSADDDAHSWATAQSSWADQRRRWIEDATPDHVGRVTVEVRRGGKTHRVGSIPPVVMPRKGDHPMNGHIGNIPVRFRYLYGDVTAVLVGSIEAASLLPGFEAVQGTPIEATDDGADQHASEPWLFISYQPEDADFVKILARELWRYRVLCWFPGPLLPTLPVPKREMIQLSRAVVAISRGEFGSDTSEEIEIARTKSIPIFVVGPSELEKTLSFHPDLYIKDSNQLAVIVSAIVKAINEPRPSPEISPDPDRSADKGRLPTTKRTQRSPPKSVQQRPAAYRFRTVGEKIDVLPELPEPFDRQLAADIQKELLQKARNLLARLQDTNSAQRVCDSVQGLLAALDVPFEQLRPGVLLSRVVVLRPIVLHSIQKMHEVSCFLMHLHKWPTPFKPDVTS